MKTKKNIFLAIGPFISALILVVLIFAFSGIKEFTPSNKEMSKAASSMSPTVLKGNIIKNNAISTSKYVAFFGSSELSRVNEFHPSVLAKKYGREYEPFLLGAPGTQSITHYFSMNSMESGLKDKKVVFVISPQWFVKEGIQDPAFSIHYSKLQVYDWMKNLDTIGDTEKYIANRLLTFSKIKSDKILKNSLEKISSGKNLDSFEKAYYKSTDEILAREDDLFRNMDIKSKDLRINKSVKNLPNEYKFYELDTLAYNIGEKKTSNNDFEISNKFYTRKISKILDSLKDSQKDFDYTKSPEFSDFQMILNEFAENNVDVLFVIPPVNQKWSNYTGISEDMLNRFSEKVNEQLKSQGFNNIVDYTYRRGEDYFMEDTIHIGWRGWLDLDQEIEPFLKDIKSSSPDYKIDNEKYLGTNWDNE